MQPSDQDTPDGSELTGLGRPEIAAEFLRRNQHFLDDQAQLTLRVASGELSVEAAHAELARRWGVSFRRTWHGPGRAATLAT